MKILCKHIVYIFLLGSLFFSACSTGGSDEPIQADLTLSDALARAYLRRENITQPSESAIAEIIKNRRPVDID